MNDISQAHFIDLAYLKSFKNPVSLCLMAVERQDVALRLIAEGFFFLYHSVKTS